MSTPKVYVYCDRNCKYEGMTKEQILEAITQAVNEGTVGELDTGFITTIKTITGTPLRFFVGTQADYEELTEEQKQNLFAIITNDTTREGILKALEELIESTKSLEEWKSLIMSGDVYVKGAEKASEATHAGKADSLGIQRCIGNVHIRGEMTDASGRTHGMFICSTILFKSLKTIKYDLSTFDGFKSFFIEKVSPGVLISASGMYSTNPVICLMHNGEKLFFRCIGEDDLTGNNNRYLDFELSTDSHFPVIEYAGEFINITSNA